MLLGLYKVSFSKFWIVLFVVAKTVLAAYKTPYWIQELWSLCRSLFGRSYELVFVDFIVI